MNADGAPAQAQSTAAAAAAAAAADSVTTRFPPIPSIVPSPLSSNEVRALVLDYLTHSTYLDSAVAFINGWEQVNDSSSDSVAYRDDAGPSTSTASIPSRPLQDSDSSANLEENDQIAEDDEDMQDVTVHPTYELDVDDVDGADQPGTSYRNGELDNFDSPHLNKKEIRLIRVRKDIKRLIQQGSIQAAIDLCNLHFPSVLAPPSSSFTATASTSSTASRPSKPISTRISIASSPSLPGKQPTNTASTSSTPSKSRPISFSTRPLLLSLALQIQLFIEIIRSNSSSPSGISRPSTPLSHASPSSNGSASMENSTASLASTSSAMSGLSGTSSAANGSTSALSQALSHAQSLHAQANKLTDPHVKHIYRKELESVSGLLPYHDPKLSPVAYYLDENRREGLAESVNGAILLSLGKSSTNSKLEDIAKQNDVVWRSLHDLKATFPPERGANKAKAAKPVLPFDMQEFLEARILSES